MGSDTAPFELVMGISATVRYFGYALPGHCQAGQKLKLVVSAKTTTTTTTTTSVNPLSTTTEAITPTKPSTKTSMTIEETSTTEATTTTDKPTDATTPTEQTITPLPVAEAQTTSFVLNPAKLTSSSVCVLLIPLAAFMTIYG